MLRNCSVRKYFKRLFIGASLLLLSGCAFIKYQSKPLSSEKVANEYQSRTLEDSLFMSFLKLYLDTIPDSVWDIKSLTLAAFYYSPDLDITRNNLEIQEGKLQTAKQRPNPRAGVTVGYQFTPGEIPVSPWLFTPSLDFIIETAGKRKLRINQANYQIENARLNISLAAWQVRSRLRLQLVNYLMEKEQFQLLKGEVALRSEYVDSLQTLYNFGEILVTEIELARINLNNARQRMIVSEGLVEETKVLLASSIGVPVTALSGKTFDYPNLSNPPVLPEIDSIKKQAVFNNLNIQRGSMNYNIAEATLKLEIAKQYPDISIGSGVRLFQGAQRWQLNPGVELPLFNHNEGPIAEAFANRDLVASTLLQLQANTLTEVGRVQAVYLSNINEFEIAKMTLQNIELRKKAIANAFNTGDLTIIDVLSVRLEAQLGSQNLLQAKRKLLLSIGSMEDVIQKPLIEKMDSLPDLEINARTINN